jgi:hypothetical protein
MGLAHRAITPLPSRHHLGPLLAVCPSTPPQPRVLIESVAFYQPRGPQFARQGVRVNTHLAACWLTDQRLIKRAAGLRDGYKSEPLRLACDPLHRSNGHFGNHLLTRTHRRAPVRVIRRAQTSPARTPCATDADGLFHPGAEGAPRSTTRKIDRSLAIVVEATQNLNRAISL